MDDEDVLADYYRRRAPEYDSVYEKSERQTDIGLLAQRIAGLLAGRHVLEVAAGTGYWTQCVSRTARSVTATDINDEVLAVARRRDLGPGEVTFRIVDAFDLDGIAGTFDAGLVGFWLSHVTRSRMAEFLQGLGRQLEPGSLVVVVDNLYVETSNHPITRSDSHGNTYQRRHLDDGGSFDVLKNFPTDKELLDLVAQVGGRCPHIEYLEYYWLLTYRTPSAPDSEGWESEAQDWIRWARHPGHDAYWSYRDSFFEAVVPAPGQRTLELGCGEGRVSRDLVQRGHRVVGLDHSVTLTTAAADADDSSGYVVGDAAALPFPDESFDLVVSYNSLMDVEDLWGSTREVSRVLTVSGRLCLCVSHPFLTSGHFASDAIESALVTSGPYLGHRASPAAVERGGLKMTFRSWHYPLEEYGRALEAQGLLIDRVREPLPSPRQPRVSGSERAQRGHRLPMFLHLRAVKGPHVGRAGQGAPAADLHAAESVDSVLSDWIGWFEEAMPVSTPDDFARKFAEEAAEFSSEPSMEEMSDVVGTMLAWMSRSGYGLADLQRSLAAKLVVNRGRRWERLADGRYKQVTESPSVARSGPNRLHKE